MSDANLAHYLQNNKRLHHYFLNGIHQNEPERLAEL